MSFRHCVVPDTFKSMGKKTNTATTEFMEFTFSDYSLLNMVQHPPPDNVQVHLVLHQLQSNQLVQKSYPFHQVVGEKFALLSRTLLLRLEGVARVVQAEACIKPQVDAGWPGWSIISTIGR